MELDCSSPLGRSVLQNREEMGQQFAAGNRSPWDTEAPMSPSLRLGSMCQLYMVHRQSQLLVPEWAQSDPLGRALGGSNQLDSSDPEDKGPQLYY